MRYLILLLAIMAPTFAGAFDPRDTFTTEKVLAEYNSDSQSEFVYKVYAIAVTETLQVADAFNTHLGVAQQFCMPSNVSLSSDMLISMVNVEVENARNRGEYTDYATTHFPLVALLTLNKFFPCK